MPNVVIAPHTAAIICSAGLLAMTQPAMAPPSAEMPAISIQENPAKTLEVAYCQDASVSRGAEDNEQQYSGLLASGEIGGG
jgi:hypothetical protein